MEFGTPTCERCGLPRGDGGFCANCGVLNALPEAGLYAGSHLSRFWARLLDSLLFVLTGGVGWWIWLATSSAQGQSPAKRMLGLRVVGADGAPLDAGAMWFRDGVLALLLTPLLPLNALWALRSPRRQTIHDLLAGSVVVKADAKPLPGFERDRDRRPARPEALPSPRAPSRGATAGPAERGAPASGSAHPEPRPPFVLSERSESKPVLSAAEGETNRPARPEPRTRSTGPARSQTPATSGSTTRRRTTPSRHPVSKAPPRSGSSDHPPDDRPMWPGGVPPWRRSPGSAPPPTAPSPIPPPPRPLSRRPGRVTDRGVEFPDDVTTPMAKIAELERRYRAGQMSQADFEDARRRIIAES